GERQRVALARALINHPPLLLADEPTGNLDDANSRHVEDILFDLVSTQERTLILVTHNEELAERTGRVLRLESGCLFPA
ncbi:MAG: ATP-binding cassette domain-containing protein, partial [Spirochaeta sp.]|nr:ATP-binding cassette domain-containing protein [Spirochaeta sp.]